MQMDIFVEFALV